MNENNEVCAHTKVDTYTNRWALLVTPGGAKCYDCGAQIHTQRRTRLFACLGILLYCFAMTLHPGLGSLVLVNMTLFGGAWFLRQPLNVVQPGDKPRDSGSDSARLSDERR